AIEGAIERRIDRVIVVVRIHRPGQGAAGHRQLLSHGPRQPEIDAAAGGEHAVHSGERTAVMAVEAGRHAGAHLAQVIAAALAAAAAVLDVALEAALAAIGGVLVAIAEAIGAL